MNILVDINHPAHFHLFKNFIFYVKTRGHNPVITIRDKDVTEHLLSFYNLPHSILTRESRNYVGKFREVLVKDYRLLRLHKKYNFSFSLGTSVAISHLTLMRGVPSYNFNEDDDYIDPLFEMLTYPFSTKIIVPACMPINRYREKKVVHNSYHELAYLHPSNFTPSSDIIESYGLRSREYVLIRKSALNATHDRGARGLSGSIWAEVQNIMKNQTIILSDELDKRYKIKPWHMHDIIAHAKLVISDSQTMTAEAAVLGTPSVRYTSFVGKISYLEELEHVYGLTFGFVPGMSDEAMLEKIKYLLDREGLLQEWILKKERMLKEKQDLTQWMIGYFSHIYGL